ncbi:endonuclease [Halobacteriovorax sp. XZX-3]|uniref:endonuclease I family protein n=1 Tax=unclassified Halobacteriovorax TaxID=2639665 RepID=UPI001304E9F2|nr:endonuclease [Halobacteriovorax sp. DA5]
MKLKLLVAALLALTTTAGYYPESFKAEVANDLLQDENLRTELQRIISQNHKKNSYSQAKRYLFNELHLKYDESNQPYVKGVYCNKVFNGSTPNIGPIGDGKIPNHQIVNCEHTWPQSKFTGGFSSQLQKGDLHHLFPTDSKANSVRSSNDFADLKGGKAATRDCFASHSDGHYFEPPTEHKGNVARAMFYFATRYGAKINSRMEKYLRRWHAEDPVDSDEIERNNKIEEIQGNRNPYIDFPELVSDIKDF